MKRRRIATGMVTKASANQIKDGTITALARTMPSMNAIAIQINGEAEICSVMDDFTG